MTPKELAEEEEIVEPPYEELSFSKPWRELAEKFRRLAAEASAEVQTATDEAVASWHLAESQIWEQAAQMVEERLNGS